jgi:hypothetical protein
MSTTQSAFITITCDGPGCEKSVTFAATQQGQGEAINDNPWMNSLRSVLLPDERRFSYCSDECEVKSTSLGKHNKVERTLVTPSGNQAQIEMLAKAAAQAKLAEEAMKKGQGIQITG